MGANLHLNYLAQFLQPLSSVVPPVWIISSFLGVCLERKKNNTQLLSATFASSPGSALSSWHTPYSGDADGRGGERSVRQKVTTLSAHSGNKTGVIYEFQGFGLFISGWNSSFLSNQPISEENWQFLTSHPFYLPSCHLWELSCDATSGEPSPGLISSWQIMDSWDTFCLWPNVSSALQDLQKARSEDKKSIYLFLT